MLNDNSHHIAVLTGDLVGSTTLGPHKIERAMAALADCAQRLDKWNGGSLHFTRTRGDGWQVALNQTEYTLRAALSFRASLRRLGRKYDTYIGIAENEISGKLSDNLNTENSAAFWASGNALERLKRSSAPRKMEHSSLIDDEPLLYLLEELFDRWTPIQSEAMYEALTAKPPYKYSDIAETLGKSRQTVTKSLKAAGDFAILQALMIHEARCQFHRRESENA
jgi:AraC-like DNA-binding protein